MKNGLCMWCGVKFTGGHRSFKSRLYHILVDYSNESMEDNDQFLDCIDHVEGVEDVEGEEDGPVISLHALISAAGYQTMKVQGKIKNKLVSILIDIGSTHNFVD